MGGQHNEAPRMEADHGLREPPEQAGGRQGLEREAEASS